MTAAVRFTKMQGIGNDYVYINGFEDRVENPGELARRISDRHFGVGSDGLVLILPSGTADVRMRMFNADGTEAEMCGNAIRCVGKYVHDHGILSKDVIRVETRAGEKVVRLLSEGGEVCGAQSGPHPRAGRAARRQPAFCGSPRGSGGGNLRGHGRVHGQSARRGFSGGH